MNIKAFIEKIRVWMSSPAGKASMYLIIASAVLIILGVSEWGNLTEKAAINTNSILFGIATNFIGIVITISFVQFFFDKQREKDERNEEKKKILRCDKIMQDLIDVFTVHFNQLTTPLDRKSGDSNNNTINIDFAFTDLRGLYQVSLLFQDKIYSTSIVSFYESELKLRDYCSVSLRDIDYKYYPEIGELLLRFVRVSTSQDVRNFVLSIAPKSLADKGMSSIISEWIGDASKDWVEHVHSGELKSNIMIPFVVLYDMLKEEGQIVFEYCEAISKIKAS